MIRGRTSRLLILGFLTFSVLLFNQSVNAQYGQYGQYGGSLPSKTILIEKMVGKPVQTKGGTDQLDFVDNLSPSDPRFAPEQQIVFRLKVKNTSDMALKGVEVKDFVPAFLTPVSVPGSFDAASRTITFNAGDFAMGEEKIYFLTMKIFSQNQMPADKGVICEINKAQATTKEVFDEDSSQFCIEKQVLGVQHVPSAGPEMGLALMGLEFGLLGVGITLKKRAK